MSEQHETTASVDFLNDKPAEIATSLNEIFFSPSITAVKNNQGDDQAVATLLPWFPTWQTLRPDWRLTV